MNSFKKLSEPLIISKMHIEDIDEVSAIEKTAYPFPWTRGHFEDSLKNHHLAFVARAPFQKKIMGYFVLMPIIDEMHLLNICVNPIIQKKGLGSFLMKELLALAKNRNMEKMLLEVRCSNHRAIKLYEQFNFKEIGRRKAYYLANEGTREDAIVMAYLFT